MLRVGLTGGIGSGKSVIARLFAELDVPVIDADVIARELVEPGQPALQDIKAEFGQEFIRADGTLDRERLKDHIFTSAEARQALEAILHPRVRDVMQKKIGVLTAPYCIVVIPLLIEANQQSMVDRILVVDAPEELCIQRVVERDNTSKEAARRILAAQVGRKTRLAQASEIIVNDRDIEAVRGNVEQLHNKYLAIAAKTTHRH